MNDSMISKAEWKRYCVALKDVNTKLGQLAEQQHNDIKEIITMCDMNPVLRFLMAAWIVKDIRNIINKYRKNVVKQGDLTDEDSAKEHVAKPNT